MSRDVKLLHPKLQEIIPKLIKLCQDNGIIIKSLDTLRNQQEQNAIPAANTNARYPNSMHNWGVAFDFVLVDSKGQLVWDSPDYKRVGVLGKSLGLFWGGDFKTIKGDYGHFQLAEFGSMPSEKLIPTYGTPDKFIKSWKVTGGKDRQTLAVVVKVNNQVKIEQKELPLIDDRVYVPLREFAELLGAKVAYENKVINITK